MIAAHGICTIGTDIMVLPTLHGNFVKKGK